MQFLQEGTCMFLMILLSVIRAVVVQTKNENIAETMGKKEKEKNMLGFFFYSYKI